MVPRFSSEESTSLEKEITNTTQLIQTKKDDFNYTYEIERCTQWIKKNNFKKVCLQFPDYLLNDSTELALQLQARLNQVLYIMGDTAYESCCVDYVAAAHIDADAVIHFGPVCFSKTSENVPCLYIYEKQMLDIDVFAETVDSNFTQSRDIVILIDTPYIVHLDRIKEAFSAAFNFNIYPVTQGDLKLSDVTVIFVGNVLRKITNFNLSFRPKELFYYDPSGTSGILNYKNDLQILKRRYFLIEKIKDSQMIGIVIGTLAVKNYLRVIQRIKRLITLRKKKYYVISVGKPTIAKLANFPEIDIYVVISCAMNEIYDNRDFYKPIVTPFDIEVALNPRASELQFSYDYNSYLPDTESLADLENLQVQENDVSLLTGKVRYSETVEDDSKDNRVLKVDGTVSLNTFGADFLAQRGWKGLEQNLGCDEAEMASEGRRGLAQSYENEK